MEHALVLRGKCVRANMRWNLGQTVPARAGDPTADSWRILIDAQPAERIADLGTTVFRVVALFRHGGARPEYPCNSALLCSCPVDGKQAVIYRHGMQT